jgi:hypothetical protein
MNRLPMHTQRPQPDVRTVPRLEQLDTTLDQRGLRRSPVRPAPPSSERRTFLRYRSRLIVPCRLTRNTGEGPWFATVRNISARGIGLISNRQFKANPTANRSSCA